jgi:integrase/recombinase XerD
MEHQPMGIGKQAKILTDRQFSTLLSWVAMRRNPDRNRLIVLLSFKAGLRAKEIAELRWSMVMDADGDVSKNIHLTNLASKGQSGRIIPLNKEVRKQLLTIKENNEISIDDAKEFVVQTPRGAGTTAQVIVNMFQEWYQKLGFVGCSSHSGRRTAITNWAKKASLVGGSLRDVQAMAGHASLTTTSRYIESDSDAQRKLVNL